MGYGRSNEEGFRGEYPKPLDWDAIKAEILAHDADSDVGTHDADSDVGESPQNG